jgi:hypothetical protein
VGIIIFIIVVIKILNFSSEYRNAMNRHFPVILKILKVCHISPLNNNNAVEVVQPMALATTIVPTSPAYIIPL